MTRQMTFLVALAALPLSSCHRCHPSDAVPRIVETILWRLGYQQPFQIKGGHEICAPTRRSWR